MSRARLLRAQASALRTLHCDLDAQAAVVTISRDRWAGTAEELVDVARQLTSR